VWMLAIGTSAMPAAGKLTCDQAKTLPRPIPLGVSGGNINAFFGTGRNEFCSSGTLGSMVQDQSGNQYILSNNHVLADSNEASPGDLIVQPGLAAKKIKCRQFPNDAVANFTRTVDIDFSGGDNTIDAAIAAIQPGDVNPTILNIGGIASSVVSPTIGLAVEKMGSSSCFTNAKITSVNFNGTIGGYGDGGEAAVFTNQVLIKKSGFSSPGDSGSLIVTQGSCPQAVALLFAGSNNGKMTLANPISAVLSGLNVSMVGSCTASGASAAAPADVAAGSVGMSKEAVESATAVRDRHEKELMSVPGAVGTAVGLSDQPGQPAIELYVKKMTPEAQAAAPKEFEGVPVKVIENGGFVAY
jgi:hypothetical protein